MSSPVQADCRNGLLARLSPTDFGRLGSALRLEKLARGQVLAVADRPFDRVLFPEEGLVSYIVASPRGNQAEAGLFGRCGFGPTAAVLGSDRSPSTMLVQLSGYGHFIEVSALATAVAASETLRQLLLRYVQAMTVQMTSTVLSNAAHNVEARLARWLLMMHDRCDGDDLPLTHEFLSVMLSVRRASVTATLHMLEGRGFIRSDRGSIHIRDREAIEEFAADAYGAPEAEYRRLIGTF